MELIARTVAEFTSWAEADPHLLDLPTRDVLAALRRRLDELRLGWREAALAELAGGQSSVEVELQLDDRTVRGSLVQRPSGVGSTPS